MTVLLALMLLAPGGRAPSPRPEVFGTVGAYAVTEGESLVELAPTFDLGFNELADANPAIDPFVPPAGIALVVPTAWIVPRAARPGEIVVNLSEMRLYFLPKAPGEPATFPIGVAVETGATPLGRTTIVEKRVDPTWFPTASIRREDPSLPASVPPGPENPLGTHALRLGYRSILIHGTNKPLGVGRRVSHGCVRLYPEDIPRLYRLVGIGTPVTIVREPVKVGLRSGRVFVEVHEDDAVHEDLLDEATRLLARRRLLDLVDRRKLQAAVAAHDGVPADVTAGEPPPSA